MSKTNNNLPANRRSRIATVNAHDLRVNPAAQREFKPAWAERILGAWDIDKFQRPHVNQREDGSLYIMEGQHGTHAYTQKYGTEGQALPIQVELYVGLSEREEADFFLAYNNKKAVDALPKFNSAVTAGWAVECDIDRIVRANGCRVTGQHVAGAISAVNALRTAYGMSPAVLAATIRVLRDSFGDGGYERANVLGVASVVARYNLDETALATALLGVRGGSKGLSQQAALNRETFGCTVADATSAAIVDVYNKGKKGRSRIPSWWSREGVAA